MVLQITSYVHARYFFLPACLSLCLKKKGGKKKAVLCDNWNPQCQIAGKLLKPVSRGFNPQHVTAWKLIICILNLGNKTTYLVICFPLTPEFLLILPKLLCEYSTHTSWNQHCYKDSLVSL